MKLGIMQPYLFPYVGYFSLIKYTDEFIFFDTPQYISHGWVNRNRILKQDGTANYFIIPIQKCKRETAIRDIRINENEKWREKIYGQLSVYKKKAPHYKKVEELVHNVLDGEYAGVLSNLNINSIIETCKYLGIERKFSTFSEMSLEIEEVHAPDEWALNITEAIGGDVYVNPPGGMDFFDSRKYKQKNIRLEFLTSNLKPYVQRIGHFEPGLSIIDVLMFCSEEEILDILDDYTIIEGEKDYFLNGF